MIYSKQHKVISVSEKAHPLLLSYLQQKGMKMRLISNLNGSMIGTHADLYYCQMGETVYHAPNKIPEKDYPGDSVYNAACTGIFFIHNTKITSPDLITEAKKKGMIIINVKQGYAKCNCAVIDKNSIITSDAGIAKKCCEYNRSNGSDTAHETIECLLIRPGHIALEGFKYGFIGGASGRIGDEIIFNGDLSLHPDYIIIRNFITERGLKLKYFDQYPLTDIGSIVCGSELIRV
jgi:hypothetical protein